MVRIVSSQRIYPASRAPRRTPGELTPPASTLLTSAKGLFCVFSDSVFKRLLLRLFGVAIVPVGFSFGITSASGSVQKMASSLSTVSRSRSGWFWSGVLET